MLINLMLTRCFRRLSPGYLFISPPSVPIYWTTVSFRIGIVTFWPDPYKQAVRNHGIVHFSFPFNLGKVDIWTMFGEMTRPEFFKPHGFPLCLKCTRVLPALKYNRPSHLDTSRCYKLDWFCVKLQSSVLDGRRCVHHFILPSCTFSALQFHAVNQCVSWLHHTFAVKNTAQNHLRFHTVKTSTPRVEDIKLFAVCTRTRVQSKANPARLWHHVRRRSLVFNHCRTFVTIRTVTPVIY